MNNNLNLQSSKSQNSRIFAHLKSHKSITALQALHLFGCFRLASRINDISSGAWDGLKHVIKSEFIKLKSGKRIKRYWI